MYIENTSLYIWYIFFFEIVDNLDGINSMGPLDAVCYAVLRLFATIIVY